MKPVLETERLLLRVQRAGDLDDLAGILGDAATMSFYPRPFTRDEVRGWIERSVRRYEERRLGLFAVTLKDTGRLVGQCGLLPQLVRGTEEIEVGWHINRRDWRRGYASEAGLASRDFAFEVLGLRRLISLIRPENLPSQGVARRLGMTVECKIMRADLPHFVFSTHRGPFPEPGRMDPRSSMAHRRGIPRGRSAQTSRRSNATTAAAHRAMKRKANHA